MVAKLSSRNRSHYFLLFAVGGRSLFLTQNAKFPRKKFYVWPTSPASGAPSGFKFVPAKPNAIFQASALILSQLKSEKRKGKPGKTYIEAFFVPNAKICAFAV
jgi:hypothetical protein